MGKGKYDAKFSPETYQWFVVGVIATQFVGAIMIILCGFWMGDYLGGFNWNTDSLVFNYHPFFMTIGMIFLYGDALLVYRLFNDVTKVYIKILHALIHIGALAFGSVALAAAFDSHNRAQRPIPNMYSLHSWIGLTAMALFGMQWVCGFVSFLLPKLSENFRRFYLPHHKFWGITIYCMIVCAALIGITQKAFFSLPNGAYSQLPSHAYLINFYGGSIVIFSIMVIYLVTKYDYARLPDPYRF